jgi:membrane peptidoglycan carboxypeptidase
MKRRSSFGLSIIFCCALAFIAIVFLRASLELPEATLPAFLLPGKKLTIDNRRTVPAKAISPNMYIAIVAIEDHRFYNHKGIDLWGNARALFVNLESGKLKEGGSTITQQLAKNVLIDRNESGLNRGVKQWFLAWDLENKYSKEEILTAYLNAVYFGRGAYGIEDAAKTYFAKAASQLSLSEASFLAGLVQAPSVYGSPANLDKAIKRQREVFERLRESKLAQPQELLIAENSALVFRKK